MRPARSRHQVPANADDTLDGAGCRRSSCSLISIFNLPSHLIGRSLSDSQSASPIRRMQSPERRLAKKGLASCGFAKTQPCGGSSSVTPKRVSVAVVIAASPCRDVAISLAIRLPALWPPSKGTQNCPSSETASTGGSSCFSRRWGASRRIKIPAAHTPIIGRFAVKSA